MWIYVYLTLLALFSLIILWKLYSMFTKDNRELVNEKSADCSMPPASEAPQDETDDETDDEPANSSVPPVETSTSSPPTSMIPNDSVSTSKPTKTIEPPLTIEPTNQPMGISSETLDELTAKVLKNVAKKIPKVQDHATHDRMQQPTREIVERQFDDIGHRKSNSSPMIQQPLDDNSTMKSEQMNETTFSTGDKQAFANSIQESNTNDTQQPMPFDDMNGSFSLL